jgi:hypothetical protein
MESFMEIYSMIGDLFVFYKEIENKALNNEKSDAILQADDLIGILIFALIKAKFTDL